VSSQTPSRNPVDRRFRKSRDPVPAPDSPIGYDLELEARKARRHLWGPTLFYVPLSLGALAAALSRPESRLTGVAFFVLGLAAWPLVEYAAHRYVLHGAFPDGPGRWNRLLHRLFDDLHWEHHAHPWDGDRIGGSLRQTLPFAALLVLLALALAPWYTLALTIAALMLGFIGEEWTHYALHLHPLPGRYYRRLRRHHAFHHSIVGAELAWGVSSPLWDILLRTGGPPTDPGRNRSTSSPA
jgi:4-hydroxysphinganine ceramide fatty acyl 2-hydroxylase